VKIDPNVTSTPSSASSLPSGTAPRAAPSDASTQSTQTTQTSQTQTSAPTASAPATANAAATDPVNLSTISTQLRALGAGFASSTGDIDTKRVSELKDAISKGNLSVDSSKIADGLLDTVRGLLQSSQE